MKKMFLLAASTALLAGGVAVASQMGDESTTFTITEGNQTNVPRSAALLICPGELDAGCAIGEQYGEQLKYAD